jgi:hypothetical protein
MRGAKLNSYKLAALRGIGGEFHLAGLHIASGDAIAIVIDDAFVIDGQRDRRDAVLLLPQVLPLSASMASKCAVCRPS